MNAIESLRKHLIEAENARKTEAQENLKEAGSQIKSIPRERIAEYFDTVVNPVFEQIKYELNPYPFKVFVRRQVYTIQLTIREDDASTYFKVSLKNNEPMIIEMIYQYGSAHVHIHRTEVVFFRERVDLGVYKSITCEKLLGLFTENFVVRRKHPEKLRAEEEKRLLEESEAEPQEL